MTITALLAIMAMQTFPAPAGPGWHQVGGDAAGSYAVYSESVRRSGDDVTAVVRIDVTRGARTGRRIIGVIRYVYHCAAGTYRMEAGDLYDADGTYMAPAPLTAEHHGDRPVPENTPTSGVRDYLCRGQAQ